MSSVTFCHWERAIKCEVRGGGLAWLLVGVPVLGAHGINGNVASWVEVCNSGRDTQSPHMLLFEKDMPPVANVELSLLSLEEDV